MQFIQVIHPNIHALNKMVIDQDLRKTHQDRRIL